MPLPQLNTGGIDVTNTIAKIAGMKHQDLQNQNLESEIKVREANSPSLIAERESMNELRKADAKYKAIKQKNEEVAMNTKLMDSYAQGMSLVKPEEWDKFRAYYSKASGGMLDSIMPAADAFNKPADLNGKVVPDTEAFEKHKEYVLDAHDAFKSGAKVKNQTVYIPDEDGTYSGKTLSIPVREGKTVDPVAATGIKGATFTDLGKKEKEEDSLERQTKRDEETVRHNKVTEKTASEKATREKSDGSWSYIGTSDDKKSIIQQHSKSGEVRIKPMPEDKTIEAKPGKEDEAKKKIVEALTGGNKDNKDKKSSYDDATIAKARAWALDASKKNPANAAKYKKDFETKTGQKL